MANGDFFNLAWWLGILVGAIVGFFLQSFVQGVLPSKFKEKTFYFGRQIAKWINRPKINVELILKTPDMSNYKLDLDTVVNLLQDKFCVAGFSPAREGDSLLFGVPIGRRAIQAKISPSTTDIDGKLVVDQIQCNLRHECGYAEFRSDVREMREAQLKIQPIMRKNLVDFMDDVSLMCELKELYELTGVLSEHKIGSIQSSIETGRVRFDLSNNRLIVYGKEINEEILSIMKKMITVYY